jgi:integrase
MSTVTDAAGDPNPWGLPPFKPVPFGQLAEEFERLYMPPARSAATLSKTRYVLNLVAELLGPDGTSEDLTAALVSRFLASRPPGESSYTTHSLLRIMRVLSRYSILHGHARVDPFQFRQVGQWVRLEPLNDAGRHHSRGEVARLLETARAEAEAAQEGTWTKWKALRLWALVSTVAFTGLRKMEALHLAVDDVDLAGGLITVRPHGGRRLKTAASAADVPVPPDLAPVLAHWLPHAMGGATGWVFPGARQRGPWTGGAPGDKALCHLARLGERAGVEGVTFLSLRHSFGTHAEHWGLSPLELSRVMRHTNQQTQRYYRHKDADNLRDIGRRIGFGPVPPAPPKAPGPGS